jgi:hypothetical protein
VALDTSRPVSVQNPALVLTTAKAAVTRPLHGGGPFLMASNRNSRFFPGTDGYAAGYSNMGQVSKSSKTTIPEPSYRFFVWALGGMLMLVIITTVYFSLAT